MRVEASEEGRAEMRRLNAFIEEALGAMPSVHTVDPVETRRQRSQGGGVFGTPVRLDHAEERVVSTAGAMDVPIRVLRPDSVRGVYLHIHGGGWVLGAHDEQDERLWAVAQHAGLAVVSVGYRLAPEHPFPAGADDCEVVARWLLGGGITDVGAPSGAPVVIGGESAGAHLSVLTLIRLRDAGIDLSPIVGANLVYGAYDLGGTPSQRRWGDRNLILSGPIMTWFYEAFVPGSDAEGRRDPSISPLYADLTGLPPALFIVGDTDPLLDDSLFMAARWQAAGNDADLWVFPDCIHGFNAFPGELGAACTSLQHELLDRVLGGRG